MEPISDENRLVAIEYLNQLDAILDGTGEHEGHQRRQVGRCVYCSCGVRVQGRLRTL